jgi:hypothetical protein
MNENDEDVVHAGIVSKSQKIPEFMPILEFAMHGVMVEKSEEMASPSLAKTPGASERS